MNKTADFFSRFLYCGGLAILLLTGCASVPKPDNPERPKVEAPEKEPQWEPITNISQLTGLWVSEEGNLYEWPFELNGKTYLRYAWAETDDTKLWVDYAQKHNRDFMDVWNHRFSYMSAVYGRDYPLADENGTQIGLKFRTDYSRRYSNDIPFRVYMRQEYLMPINIAQQNLSFFMISGKNTIKETGTLDFHSAIFNSLDSDGKTYTLTRDYWKE
ncbi:MAG: hypothetical protein IKI90_01095 [Treponema sp.]|nr:hypothetical protein [Treponema sp.]